MAKMVRVKRPCDCPYRLHYSKGLFTVCSAYSCPSDTEFPKDCPLEDAPEKEAIIVKI